ncbi:thiamine-phosphate kinase [Candidatus Woesearchaeota archaeon]|nr:thiamine-phosphate kinase [Candidatus Woesearchaeota archaeon]|tara:strand:- start:24219 stop:25175 length:957 start_codon:yes stop_codon:yes gene_type:complete
MKVSKLGERKLIERISKKISLFSKDVVKGIGDDCAVIKFDKKKYMLLTTDTLVEKVHFKFEWFKPEQLGKLAVESNVSDIAAMGGFPKYMLVSLNLPKKISVKFVDRLYDGINKASKKYKVDIIGGNLASSEEMSITITLIGFVEKKMLCLRGNARVGDLICITGKIGRTTAALGLLKSNIKGKSTKYFLNSKARLDAARKLSAIGVNAMQDNSDGLTSEVRHICEESKTGAVIDKSKLLISKEVVQDMKKLGFGREYYNSMGDYLELVFTIPKKKISLLNKIDHRVIGKIVDKKKGIYLLDGKKKYKLSSGYEHFRK